MTLVLINKTERNYLFRTNQETIDNEYIDNRVAKLEDILDKQ